MAKKSLKTTVNHGAGKVAHYTNDLAWLVGGVALVLFGISQVAEFIDVYTCEREDDMPFVVYDDEIEDKE